MENSPIKISSKQLKLWSQSNDQKGFVRLLSPLAALAITTLWIHNTRETLWIVPAMWGHGLILISFFAPLHESIHFTAFRSRWLNKAVANICGFLLVLPPTYFRIFHLAHHRYTQDPEHDPELLQEKPATLTQYLWYVSGIPYWKERITTTTLHTLHQVEDPGFLPSSVHRQVVREARVFTTIYLLLAAISLLLTTSALLLYWIIPVFLAQPALRLYLLAEHTGCLLVDNMLLNTRSTLTNSMIRHLMWEMPYHIEHHLYPSVPFHQLPQLHSAISQHEGCWSPGYYTFHKSLLAKIRSNKI